MAHKWINKFEEIVKKNFERMIAKKKLYLGRFMHEEFNNSVIHST